MSWKAEVQTSGGDDWTGNAVRVTTKDECDRYARDLMWRWTAVTAFRTVECDDPVNYRWVTATGLQSVEQGATQ